MPIDPVRRGEPQLADQQNKLIGQHNRDHRGEPVGDVAPSWGPEGDNHLIHGTPELAIFELTGGACCPGECDASLWPEGWCGEDNGICEPDVPWSLSARPVWFWKNLNIYGTTVDILGYEDVEHDLFFPTLECVDVEDFKATDRFHVRFNRQAGRWEAICCTGTTTSSSSGSSLSSSSSSSSSGSSSSSSSGSSSSSSSGSSSSGSSSSGVSSSSSGECVNCFEGICMSDIPAAVPVDGDYVLGIQDGCLVKFVVNDCTSSGA